MDTKLKRIAGVSVFLCIFMLGMGYLSMGLAKSLHIKTWLCYYGTKFGPEVYSRFDLVVLDGRYHPPLAPRPKGKPTVLGYVSIGEVEEGGHLWPCAKNQPYLVRKNELWNSWIVDVRHPSWQALLFERVVPSVLDRGFDGLFLDTLDSSLSLSLGQDRETFTGIAEALDEIITKIRERYPGKLIGVNRGLPALPVIARKVDFVVVEDLYSYYAGPDQGYLRVNRDTQDLLLQQIDQGLKANPDLLVLTLDYAAPDQTALAREAISFSRKRGFIPYVSTYKLDEIFYYSLDK